MPKPLHLVAETRFGATTEDVGTAAGLLRAQASARGMQLTDASEIDLAAAVIGADALLAFSGSPTLWRAAHAGAAARKVLCSVLMRAAGCATNRQPAELDVDTRAGSIELADGYRLWATARLGPERAAEALRRAAGDLATAGPGSELGSFAGNLLVCAEAPFCEASQEIGPVTFPSRGVSCPARDADPHRPLERVECR